MNAARPVQHGAFKVDLATNDVRQVETWLQPKKHVHVGETDVGVQQTDVLAPGPECNSNVGRYVGLANTTLAAAYRDNLRWPALHEAPEIGIL